MTIDLNAPEVQEAIKKQVEAQIEGLNGKKEELLSEAKAAKKKAADAAAELEKLKASVDGVDVEEYAKLKKLQEDEETRKAEEKGEFDKLKLKLKETHAEELKKAQERAQSLESAFHAEIKMNAILKALEAEEGNSALLSHVVGSRIQVKETESGISVIGLDEKGEPMMTEGGDIATALDVVKHLKTKEEYQPAFKATMHGGGGSGPSRAGNGKINPWKADTRNLTEQGIITRDNPVLASQLKKEAGITA